MKTIILKVVTLLLVLFAISCGEVNRTDDGVLRDTTTNTTTPPETTVPPGKTPAETQRDTTAVPPVNTDTGTGGSTLPPK